MKHPAVAAISLAMAVTLSLALPRAMGDDRPNIVIMMADDMGFSDLGCYGGEIRTPHLDRLAAAGLRFTQFYNTARCCPTRAALLTGLYQHQAGIGHMTGNDNHPGYRGVLNDTCVTIAEALRPAGYQTLMVGKWHVGSPAGHWPLERGFDRYWGTPSGGGVYFKDALEIRKNVFFVHGDERVEVPDDFYVTDAFTDYALRFIDEAAKKDAPFFLYFAHIAPHWPLQAKADDIAKYKDTYKAGWDAIRAGRFDEQRKLGLFAKGVKLSPRDPRAKAWDDTPAAKQADMAHRMAVYAAQIDCIDQNVGRLVAKLKATGRFENTLFLFLSDNGCSAEGGPGGFSRGRPGAPIGTGLSYASAGLEWANVSDTPFQRYKMDVHEGGISSPLIAHWPKGIARRGDLEHQPGHLIDLMATCVDVSGAAYPTALNGKSIQPPQGRSLRPAFAGRPLGRDAPLFWEHQGNQAIRDGKWKLVRGHGEPWQLYDLDADRTELNDLAEQHPNRAAALKEKYEAWMKRANVLPWNEVQRLRKARNQGQ